MIKLKAFTLVELTVVITIIVILSTFVAINLTSAQKKARDEKRISDAQLIGNALDQYATSHARQYPCPDPGCNEGNLTFGHANITANSWISQKLSAYVNPVPVETKTATDFKYVYVYRKDGLQAAVVVKKFETGDSLCNVITNQNSLPLAIINSGVSPQCYYVSR